MPRRRSARTPRQRLTADHLVASPSWVHCTSPHVPPQLQPHDRSVVIGPVGNHRRYTGNRSGVRHSQGSDRTVLTPRERPGYTAAARAPVAGADDMEGRKSLVRRFLEVVILVAV